MHTKFNLSFLSAFLTLSLSVFAGDAFSFADFSTASYSLNVARTNYSAVRLYDGTVLVSGGFIDDSTCGSTSTKACASDTLELIDPSTGSVTLLSDTMSSARAYHSSAVFYYGGNQQVLICGGYDYDASARAIKTCDLYDHTTQSVTATSSMSYYRSQFTLTTLPGNKILAVGGWQLGSTPQKVLETYDMSTNTWSSLSDYLDDRRYNHTASLVQSGGTAYVVIAGGYSSSAGELDSIELFDVSASSVGTVATLNHARESHTADHLTDGTVIFVGGENSSEGALDSGEIFDIDAYLAGSTSVRELTSVLHDARYGHATALLEKNIVIVGGLDSSGAPISGVECYNDASDPVHPEEFTSAFNGSSIESLDTAVSGIGNAGGFQGVMMIDSNSAVIIGGSTTGDEDGATTIIQTLEL